MWQRDTKTVSLLMWPYSVCHSPHPRQWNCGASFLTREAFAASIWWRQSVLGTHVRSNALRAFIGLFSLALIQLHSSLAGGNSGQGWMDDVLVPAPPLDPDAVLDADAPLDPVARLDP